MLPFFKFKLDVAPVGDVQTIYWEHLLFVLKFLVSTVKGLAQL